MVHASGCGQPSLVSERNSIPDELHEPEKPRSLRERNPPHRIQWNLNPRPLDQTGCFHQENYSLSSIEKNRVIGPADTKLSALPCITTEPGRPTVKARHGMSECF